MPDRHALPPMGAIEFTIEKAFRHFFFALGLLLGWLILLLPLAGLAWYLGFRNGPPDVTAMPPAALVALGLLGLGVLLASFSIETNWNRRILLDERPSFLGRWRLDRPVWRYAAGVVLLLMIAAIYAVAGYAVMTAAVPALMPQLGAAAKPLGLAVMALIGLSGLFTLYRLLSWLAAVSVGDDDYSLLTARCATRQNRWAFLGFTFWLLFSVAIIAALGAGAFFAQQALPQPWVKPVAFAIIGLLGWLGLLVLHSVPAALYRSFRASGYCG